jgi:hypothetical protein
MVNQKEFIMTENQLIGKTLALSFLYGLAYPSVHQLIKDHDFWKMTRGVITTEILFEEAVSICGGVKRNNAKGEDHVDGGDCKEAITRPALTYYTSKKTGIVTTQYKRRALISNLKNKLGFLRCLISETVSMEVYMYKIPHSAYKTINEISIMFDWEGCPIGKWQSYQCDWETLCEEGYK